MAPQDVAVLQSLSLMQPQVAPGIQKGPWLQVAAQSAQAPPLFPHAKSTVPLLHVAPLQQPPLHVTGPPQTVWHRWLDVPQAW